MMTKAAVIGEKQELIPISAFKNDQSHVIELLIKQKVLFLHEASGEYIVPNFLSLANKSAAEFEFT